MVLIDLNRQIHLIVQIPNLILGLFILDVILAASMVYIKSLLLSVLFNKQVVERHWLISVHEKFDYMGCA